MDNRVGGGKEYHVNLSFFLSHSTEKLRRGSFLFHKKFLVSKYSMDRRLGLKEGGVSRSSVKIFLSHSTEKLRSGTFLFFTNILLSKNFMAKGWAMRQGGVSRYSVKTFLSQSTKRLRREHLCASIISGV